MNIIKYKVTVSALIEREEKAGKEWTIISKDENGKEERGYTPEITKTVTRETQIFEQTVETLNMAALVMTVNGLQAK